MTPSSPFPGKGPYLMGIVNVTPDSFSDGGRFFDPAAAIAQGVRLAGEGAQILDIGGESTRPDADPVTPDEEIRRIVPVIEGLHGRAPWLSVDTRHAATMAAALKAGANFINDISALGHDPESLPLAARAGVPVCLMHMRGTPQTMQQNTSYSNVVEEVFESLSERISVCLAAGIARENLIVDPGIGFAKTVEQNLALLENINRFSDLGVPVLLGASRKRFIAALDRNAAPEDRLPGSLAAVLAARARGVTLFRVHDVAATRQALAVFDAIGGNGKSHAGKTPKLYLLHGFIGAGKTTLSKNLAEKTGAIRFTADEWMVDFYGTNPPADQFSECWERVRNKILDIVPGLLGNGQSVILDSGLWNRKERDEMRVLARRYGAEPIFFRVTCSIEEMRRRVRKRTQEMPPGALFIDDNAFDVLYRKFQPFGPDEEAATDIVVDTSGAI